MRELTKAEDEIMQHLWKLEEAYVKDIIALMPTPKPAYTTVSTIVRILERKGFVGHHAYGKTHEYYPIISKKEYTRSYMQNFMSNYFSNSFKEMVSFFAKEDNISVAELDEMMKDVKKEIEEEGA